MASNLKLGTAAVDAMATSFGALLNSGYLKIYDGAQPATANTAVTTQVNQASLRFNSTAFSAASSGILTANAITSDTGATGSTDSAAWFRALESDGVTPVFDGSVSTTGSDLDLASVTIGAGATVSVSSLVFTVSK